MQFLREMKPLISRVTAGFLSVSVILSSSSAANAAAIPGPLQPQFQMNPAIAKHRVPKPPLQVIRSFAVQAKATAKAAYTILDVGAPAGTTYSYPSAFNNSGQIVGQGYDASQDTYDCFAYTGPKSKRFIDLTAGSSITQCEPTAITGPSGNTFSFVGYGFEATLGSFGVTGSVTTGGSSKVNAITNVVTSQFIGVNSAGEAVGTGIYVPAGGFFDYYPPYVLSPGSSAAALAQPQCTTPLQYCAYGEYQDFVCPFGGCEINDAGLVTGVDASNGYAMVYTPGGSAADLPFYYVTTALNNRGQVLYDGYNCGSSTCTATTNLYSLKAQTTTSIALPKKSTCAGMYGLSLNNLGEVLGETENCTASSDYVYWTWTATGGLKIINNEIPANSYSYVIPLGVNDAGEILVELYGSSAIHWGMLVPKA